MANPLENGQSANLPSEETTPQEEPLGIRNPLLSPTPLGQGFLSPKFLLPLGARPLSTVDFSTFSLDDTLVQGFLDEAFWDSPFLDESPPSLGSTPLAAPLTNPKSVAEKAANSSTFVQPQLETSAVEKAATSSTVVQPQVETSAIENAATSSTFVQPQLETAHPESLTNAPRNLTTDSNELEATTSKENSSSSLPSFKTEVPGKEIRVQKAEVPEVTKPIQPSVVDVRESTATPQPKITPQSNQNIPVDVTKSTQPSVTNVIKSHISSQPKISPQSDANIAATKSELSVQRSQTSLPITESEPIVSGLDEIVQPQERTQKTVDSPSIQRTEASSQAKEPTHKSSTPESDRQIALTRDVHETLAPSELTENSTEAESLVQTKAASELTSSITSGLDESASEKRQETGNKRQESPSNSLDLTPDSSMPLVQKAAARSDASDATEAAASVTSKLDPFPVNDRATTPPEQGLPITASQESLVQREETNSEVTASNDSPFDAASAKASDSLDSTVSRVDQESLVQRAKTLLEGTASTQALETTGLDQSAPKLNDFTSPNPTTSATVRATPIQRLEDFQQSVAPVLDDSTPDNSPTTQSNYTEAAVEKDSVVQRSAIPSEDSTRKESIGAVSESNAIAPSEVRAVTAQGELLSKKSETSQNQHSVQPDFDTSTSEPKTLTSANKTTSVPKSESFVQRSQVSEVAQPTPPITSAIPELVKSLVQRAKSLSEDSESTEPVTSKVDESGTSARASAFSNVTPIATPQADQSFPESGSGESLVQRETASSEVTAAVEPVKSARDILHASSNTSEETVSTVAGESRVQRQVAPTEVTQSSELVASAIDTFTPQSSAISEESITISPETTTGESFVQKSIASSTAAESKQADIFTSENKGISSSDQSQSFAGNSLIQRAAKVYQQFSDSLWFKGQKKTAEMTEPRDSEASNPESGTLTPSPDTTSVSANSSLLQRTQALELNAIAPSNEPTLGNEAESLVQPTKAPAEITPATPSKSSTLETSTAPSVTEDSLRVQKTQSPTAEVQATTSLESSQLSALEPSGIAPTQEISTTTAADSVVQRSESSRLEPSGIAPNSESTSVGEDSSWVQRTESPAPQGRATTSPPSSILEPSGSAPTQEISTTTTAESVVQRAESSTIETSTLASSSETLSRIEGNSRVQRREAPAAEMRAVISSESLTIDANAIAPSSKTPAITEDYDLNAIAPASETTSIQRHSEKVSADSTEIALTEHLESASVKSVSEPISKPTSVPLEKDTTLADSSFPIQRKTALPEIEITRPQTLVSKPVTPEPAETTHTDQSLIQRKTETQTPASTPEQTLKVAPTTTDPSSTSQSISELTTPASQTVAQLLSENRETPQLPRVLENLATTKHLGDSKPLVQQSEFLRAASPVESSETPTTNRESPLTTDLSRKASNRSFAAAISEEVPKQGQIIQRQVASQPTEEIPESWSSIEELLGESNVSESEPVVVQTFTERRHSAKENHQLSKNQLNVRSSKLLPSGTRSVKAQKPIEANTKLKEAISIRKKESVQPIEAQDIEQVEENTLPKVTVKREETKKEEKVSDHLDALAREIYCLVRQRLEIERERHHGLYYSGRLPW